MAQLFANNAFGVLAGAVNGAASTLVLVSGHGARFPAPAGEDYFLATLAALDSNGAESAWEIVRCTARSTDQLTVVRAQEGTTATSWNAGTRIEVRWTKAGADGKENAGAATSVLSAHVAETDPHPQYATDADLSAKQPTLVSGSNIKTVGGQSLLGSGDIAAGDVSGPAGAVNLRIAIFDGATGKSIKDGGQSLPASALVGVSEVQTMSGKTISFANNTLTGVQPTLVSGSNIKTVNGTSLLGSGNVVTGDVTLSGAQTLANKTLNAPVFNDGYTEEVFAVTGTAPVLSPANGSIQTWALSGNSTPTAGAWAAGQSITLMVDDGSAYTINWASMSITWKTGGGTAPALLTAGYTSIELAKIGTTIYGWLAGDA